MIYYILAGLFAVMGQLSDVVTTYMVISLGGHEANPFMVNIVAHPLLAYLLKISMPILGTILSYKMYAPSKKGIGIIMLIGVIGFFAATWNLWVGGVL